MENLTVKIKTGNEKAFRCVYDSMHQKVFRYFRKRNLDHEASKELTQQVFIRLWKYRERLSLDLDLEIQLFKISSQVLIDFFRKRARENKLFVASETSYDQVVSNDSFSLDPELRDFLLKSVSELSPVRRNVFLLRYFYGLSVIEIAERFSISVRTVEDHLYKASRFLKSFLSLILAFLLWL